MFRRNLLAQNNSLMDVGPVMGFMWSVVEESPSNLKGYNVAHFLENLLIKKRKGV